MKIIYFLCFFSIIITLGSVFSFSMFSLYGILYNKHLHKIIKYMYLVLPLLFIITSIIATIKYTVINSYLYTIGAVWIGMLLYLVLLAVLLFLIHIAFPNMTVEIKHSIAYSGIICVIIIIIYSIYNASSPRIVHMQVRIPKLAEVLENKTIVLFSDTHFGNVRGDTFAKKVTDLVNSQKPDLVLIAGDMIDGPIIPYKKFLKPFENIHSTFGTYYTPGNHEWYNNEAEKFLNNIPKNIITLIDKKTEVNGIQIAGVNYVQESEEKTLKRVRELNLDKKVPTIGLLHDPKYNDTLRREGIDLVVSGHTHCGQFWPINYIVRAIYKDKTYGVRQFEDSATITTCGIGTAMSPFRLGNSPEIVIIRITK